MKIIKQDLKLHAYPSGAWYISWRKNNLRHREDGPAETWYNDVKYQHLEGKYYSIEDVYWKEVHENY